MDYFVALTVPPLTDRENEVITTFEVPKGRIRQVRLTIPWGVAGLAGVRVLANEQQIYPANLGGYYTGNDTTLVIDDSLYLSDTFTVIKVCGYNDDDTFPHTFYLGMTVEPEEAEATPKLIGIWQMGEE